MPIQYWHSTPARAYTFQLECDHDILAVAESYEEAEREAEAIAKSHGTTIAPREAGEPRGIPITPPYSVIYPGPFSRHAVDLDGCREED